MVRRIFRWLARAPHGDIFTMCCTQKVVKGEPLAAARDRFVKRLTPYLAKLKREGMTAGMLTTHIVWSRRSEGWHYHVHLVVQADHNVLSTASLINWWADTGGAEAKNVSSMQSRLIVVAGDPIESLEHDDGQPLFWKESNVTVARSIQYPVRDMLQGVTMFRLGGDPGAIESKMEELYAASTQWKMRRTLGQWRKVPPLAAPAPVKDVEGADDGDAGASSAPCKKSLVGTVSKIWKSARAGNFAARMILKELEASIANSTEFSKRFILFCRSGIERQPTG